MHETCNVIADRGSICMHFAPGSTETPISQIREIPPWDHFRMTRRPPPSSAENPMGTDGFEFVEYAHPKPEELHALFRLMGYVPVARHKTRKITVYRQGDINYLVNEEPGTHGFAF